MPKVDVTFAGEGEFPEQALKLMLEAFRTVGFSWRVTYVSDYYTREAIGTRGRLREAE